MPGRLLGGLVLVTLLGIGALPAKAQKMQCVPASSCAQAFVFQPSQNQYVAAIGGTLAPSSAPSGVDIKLHQLSGSANALIVSGTGWSPPAAVGLHVQLTMDATGGTTETTPWLPVSSGQTYVPLPTGRNVDVGVALRWSVTGAETPGAFTTEVHLSLAGQTGPKETVALSVKVIVPAYLVLRVDGGPPGATASVDFDFQFPNQLAYFDAVQSGKPLGFTGANFRGVQVATNAPHGYTLTMQLTKTSGPAMSTLGVSRIYFRGTHADGTMLSAAQPTDGYQTIARPSDFTVFVDGTETPGSYGFQVTYTARTNP